MRRRHASHITVVLSKAAHSCLSVCLRARVPCPLQSTSCILSRSGSRLKPCRRSVPLGYKTIPLVLGPLNILVWYVPSLRYTRGLGWCMHYCAEVTESSTNKQHHLFAHRETCVWTRSMRRGRRSRSLLRTHTQEEIILLGCWTYLPAVGLQKLSKLSV